MVVEYTLSSYDSYCTVYNVLKDYFKVSSRLLSKLNRKKMIFLNNNPCYLSNKVFERRQSFFLLRLW